MEIRLVDCLFPQLKSYDGDAGVFSPLVMLGVVVLVCCPNNYTENVYRIPMPSPSASRFLLPDNKEEASWTAEGSLPYRSVYTPGGTLTT